MGMATRFVWDCQLNDTVHLYEFYFIIWLLKLNYVEVQIFSSNNQKFYTVKSLI